MPKETVIDMAASHIRFGAGGTREVGADLADLGARHALVFTDPNVAELQPVASVLESLEDNGVRFTLYDRVRVEPSDDSIREATRFAAGHEFDAMVAVGGGSTIDTAKAANLYSCWPADFLDYVNPPVGKGKPVPGALKPLIAIPTTAGTGSETTGTAVFDYKPLRSKTGISHRLLKPTLGIVDPDNTRTQPKPVAASAGIDVLCHATESWTAIPFGEHERPERPSARPAYQGSNPISDLWCVEAIRLTAPCCLPPHMQALASAMAASICRTPCRMRCPVSPAHRLPMASQSS
jgi:hydroxyacid-oxoacid transhydrogenase